MGGEGEARARRSGVTEVGGIRRRNAVGANWHVTRHGDVTDFIVWGRVGKFLPSWVITRVITGLLPYGEKYFLP